MMKRWTAFALAAVAIGIGAPAGARDATVDAALKAMLSGHPPIDDKELARRLIVAEKHPLGSNDNPVRVEMPTGQRAYLRRLRCSDGHAPTYFRSGNIGPGVYGSIVNLYVVDCGAAAPGQVEVRMDMYHAGHIEERPVPGFTIAPLTADANSQPST